MPWFTPGNLEHPWTFGKLPAGWKTNWMTTSKSEGAFELQGTMIKPIVQNCQNYRTVSRMWRIPLAHYVDGFDYGEIAKVQAVNYDAARMKVGRCLETVRKLVA